MQNFSNILKLLDNSQKVMKSKNMRLNQFLAKSLGLSRREADEFIQAGNVEVNKEIGQFHTKVPETNANVRLFKNDEWVDVYGKKRGTSLVMYKPIFTLVTKFDPEKRRTIYNVLPPKYEDLKPAGRLDYLSEGLLVLSDSGELLNSLTHPKFETEKVYLVGLDKPLDAKTIEKMAKGGIELDEYELVPVMVKPATFTDEIALPKKRKNGKLSIEDLVDYTEMRFLKPQKNFTWYEFILKEGRKNQIRRMCELFGYSVLRLVRVRHGKFKLDEKLYHQKYYEVKSGTPKTDVKTLPRYLNKKEKIENQEKDNAKDYENGQKNISKPRFQRSSERSSQTAEKRYKNSRNDRTDKNTTERRGFKKDSYKPDRYSKTENSRSDGFEKRSYSKKSLPAKTYGSVTRNSSTRSTGGYSGGYSGRSASKYSAKPSGKPKFLGSFKKNKTEGLRKNTKKSFSRPK